MGLGLAGLADIRVPGITEGVDALGRMATALERLAEAAEEALSRWPKE